MLAIVTPRRRRQSKGVRVTNNEENVHTVWGIETVRFIFKLLLQNFYLIIDLNPYRFIIVSLFEPRFFINPTAPNVGLSKQMNLKYFLIKRVLQYEH